MTVPSRCESAFFAALDTCAVEQVFSDLEVYRDCMERARACAPNEVEGFFGPRSLLWRVFGDPLVSAGAIRAVALQIAHPAIAAAGIQNSQFRQNFIGRARRTYATISELVFGDVSTACAASERIHVVDAMVRGTVPPEASPARAGSTYRANDPRLLMWVLATLYEASVFASDRLIEPMPRAERARFYEEMRVLGLLIGIPCEDMPSDLGSFDRYWESMAATELETGAAARELMAFLVSSSLSRLTRWTQVASLTRFDDAWIRMSIPHEWAVGLGGPGQPALAATHEPEAGRAADGPGGRGRSRSDAVKPVRFLCGWRPTRSYVKRGGGRAEPRASITRVSGRRGGRADHAVLGSGGLLGFSGGRGHHRHPLAGCPRGPRRDSRESAHPAHGARVADRSR
jgi:uncharacterized protein (DUF2236 family)